MAQLSIAMVYRISHISPIRFAHHGTLMPHELFGWDHQFHVEVTKFCGATRGNLASSLGIYGEYMGMSWKSMISWEDLNLKFRIFYNVGPPVESWFINPSKYKPT